MYFQSLKIYMDVMAEDGVTRFRGAPFLFFVKKGAVPMQIRCRSP